jgi:hypothetical protein
MNNVRRMKALLFSLETNGKRMKRPAEIAASTDEEAQSFRIAEKRFEKGPIS